MSILCEKNPNIYIHTHLDIGVTCKALWCLTLLADKHPGTTLTAPLLYWFFQGIPTGIWVLRTQILSVLTLARIHQLVVPQAVSCSPAVQFQPSTIWQLTPECNTGVSPSRDHCCYCSPPDWEALPAFGTVCQKSPTNIPQVNWCRSPGVRTDIDAEGNSHPESQWQKENVARVSITSEHSLGREEMEEEGGETLREKEREN